MGMVALRRPKSSSQKSRILARSPVSPRVRRKSGSQPVENLGASEDDYGKLAQQLAEVERAGAELVSSLTHDLRNPLSVILVSARLLARSLGAGHAGKRHLDAMTRAADEINQPLQDVSDASNIEAGRLALAC